MLLRGLGIMLVAALAGTLAAKPSFAETGFYTDKRTGCRFVTVNLHKDATVQWSGGCKDGFLDGPSVVTLVHSVPGETGAVEVRIEGTFAGGALNGRALVTYADGSRYEGEFNRGIRVGRGRLIRPGVGQFDTRDREKGGYAYSEVVYDKDCRCDTPGGRYVGETFGGQRYGKGILTLANGDKYEGEWRSNLPEGAGTLTQGGKSYSGRWSAGCSQSASTTYKFLVTSCSR